MSETTKIQWCDHTFNPWRGCARVSDGCRHCYAETLSKRNPKVLGTWGVDGTRAIGSEAYWREPLRWHRAAVAAGERRRVFCASLADVFEDRPDVVDARLRLFDVIEATPMLDWLLLTKRPENIARLMPKCFKGEPWPNVWLGASVENQACADERIPLLLDTPAAVRFISAEPLLADVGLWAFLDTPERNKCLGILGGHKGVPGLDWVIVGGESGPGARPFDVAWARSIVQQCKAASVACFVKQLGRDVRDRNDAGFEGDTPRSWPMDTDVEDSPNRYREEYQGAPVRVRLVDKKGGDPAEWPSDLRVREFPNRQQERKRA